MARVAGFFLPFVRFVFHEGNQIRLQAANRSLPVITLDSVEVLAIIVGVLRRFAAS